MIGVVRQVCNDNDTISGQSDTRDCKYTSYLISAYKTIIHRLKYKQLIIRTTQDCRLSPCTKH